MTNEELKELKDILESPDVHFLLKCFIERKEKQSKNYEITPCWKSKGVAGIQMIVGQNSMALIRRLNHAKRGRTTH